ncbi:epimerase [Knoellia sinensis KCTC 19936]|uniref:Epimerase n=1 Tax=Knoellia sinensis KCTC 19936 TaxID=1385520 RepID=A0A0A0J183_9MICO|nr:NAD-dependent epimerase/dehydratase family protein [Knoellia sinensis]KGN30863.1 epimerase [Knoellia sinensis KCTC 19936]
MEYGQLTSTDIRTEADLELALSMPSERVGADLAETRGPIVILGAGGKIGPSLATMARRSLDLVGDHDHEVLAVARFTQDGVRDSLEASGVKTLSADLSDEAAVRNLPDAGAIFYLAAMKFGTAGAEARTWWFNTAIPAMVANRYRGVPSVVYSTGNVYPRSMLTSGGATETTPPEPIGEYAQSCLGRERIFSYAAQSFETPVLLFRLNYACELRYGVVADVAARVAAGKPVDVTMPMVNVLWQGDANAWALSSLAMASTPAAVLNAAGPETVSVRHIAELVGEVVGVAPIFTGVEAHDALLSNAGLAIERFGYPSMACRELVGRVATWVAGGGRTLGKATKFEQREGRY